MMIGRVMSMNGASCQAVGWRAVLACLFGSLLSVGVAAAQNEPVTQTATQTQPEVSGGRPTLGVLKVAPTPAVQERLSRAGKLDDLAQIVEALDGQLINALQNTRRFSVIARSDLDELLNEHEIQRLTRDNPALVFQLAGVQYGVVFTIDDYRDETAMMRSSRPGESDRIARASRQINISLVAKIYAVGDGSVFESTATEHEIRKDLEYGTAPVSTGVVDKQFRDMLLGVAPQLAERAVRVVLNRVFPARVLHVQDNIATLSWGEGTTIAPGQVWRITRTTVVEDFDFPGEFIEIEHEIGRVRITSVATRSATAEIIEGSGLARGNIARLEESGDAQRAR